MSINNFVSQDILDDDVHGVESVTSLTVVMLLKHLLSISTLCSIINTVDKLLN